MSRENYNKTHNRSNQSESKSDLAVTVHHQASTRSQSWSSQGQFLLDNMLGRDTVFGIFVEDDEDHQIKSVQFTDEEGAVIGPYTKMSSVHDGINLKTINFPLGEKTPFDEVRHILSTAKQIHF